MFAPAPRVSSFLRSYYTSTDGGRTNGRVGKLLLMELSCLWVEERNGRSLYNLSCESLDRLVMQLENQACKNIP